MSVVKDLITAGNDGSICFGNYELPRKQKRAALRCRVTATR